LKQKRVLVEQLLQELNMKNEIIETFKKKNGELQDELNKKDQDVNHAKEKCLMT